MPSRDKKPGQGKDESTKSELMRRFKANPFLFSGTVFVLVIIVIAFVFVPAIVPDAFGAGDLTFGSFNRVPIAFVPGNHFHHVQQVLTQNHQPAHDDPNFMGITAQIWRHAFEEAVIRIGILDKMDRAGFVVPEDVINREMAELPIFQENGRFSLARYRAVDNSTRMTLWRQVQENHIIQHYFNDLASHLTPSREVSFVSSMAQAQRTFDMAVFPIADFPESEIVSFMEANQDMFNTVRLSSITLGSESAARQVLSNIQNGLITFEEAAMTHSIDWAADRGGDLGSFISFELVWLIGNEQARQSVLNLGTGEITDVFSVPAGWAFYRVDEAAQLADITDPMTETRVRNHFMISMRGRLEDWAISEAERFATLAEETGFDAAIAARGMTKSTFGPVPLNFGNSVLFASIAAAGVPEIQGAGNDIFFWSAAFTTPLNTLSRPIVVGDNVLVLLPLEEIPMSESDIGFIESFYPFWISGTNENAHRAYFLNHERLDDRFNETFWRLWR